MSANDHFDFDISTAISARLARGWLLLGIAALVGAGLLAVVLGVSRTPWLYQHFPGLTALFYPALIVHVDLSVLVWFMAFGGVLWSLAGNDKYAKLGEGGLLLASIGTALMVISPFLGDPQPLLNNYIPILQHPVFFAGLGIACSGFALALLRALLTACPQSIGFTRKDALQFGIYCGAVAGSLAFVGFLVSWLMRPPYEGRALYEAVFWGGGHTLQFQHALLMVAAWLVLLDYLKRPLTTSPQLLGILFLTAAAPVLAMPVIYVFAPIGTGEHIAAFARLMRVGHPLMLPLILLVALAMPALWQRVSPAKSALFASMLLFIAGGIIAFMIEGVNTKIPAHYHGSIVGVTLSFMGVAYILLPRLGYASVESSKMARWQPYVYGFGQLIHIIGLAWSGGYGTARKTAGAEQMLVTWQQKTGMGMMGMGMLLSVIGGIMFVLVCILAIRKRPA